MKILAFETSAKSVSCAVIENRSVVTSAYQCTGLTHSRTLMPMVEAMLKNADLSLDQMDGFAVSRGPGSFTGIRIGIAAVKGLAWAEEKPCCGVSTLEAMASQVSYFNGRIVCCMDARRQQIYNAVFRGTGGVPERLTPDRAISLEECLQELKESNEPCLFVGDGASLAAPFFSQMDIPCQLAPSHLLMQSAIGVGLTAEHGIWGTAQELQPVYLRMSQAERERMAKGLPISID